MGLFSGSLIQDVSVLGCGWLGMALAKALVKKGFRVNGSTTRVEKLDNIARTGAKPWLIKLVPEAEGDNVHQFLDADLLILNIPPGRGAFDMETYHPSQVQYLSRIIEENRMGYVLYISSTSVYPDTNGDVFEEDLNGTDQSPSRAIALAEELLMENNSYETTILRCGGLMGYDRIPGRYFAGRKDLTTGEIPVNFIHRDDVIGIILAIIEQMKWGKVYNAVAPMHPLRRTVYHANAQAFGFEEPTYAPNPEFSYKVVRADKLIHELGYQFNYPDPLNFKYGDE